MVSGWTLVLAVSLYTPQTLGVPGQLYPGLSPISMLSLKFPMRIHENNDLFIGKKREKEAWLYQSN